MNAPGWIFLPALVGLMAACSEMAEKATTDEEAVEASAELVKVQAPEHPSPSPVEAYLDSLPYTDEDYSKALDSPDARFWSTAFESTAFDSTVAQHNTSTYFFRNPRVARQERVLDPPDVRDILARPLEVDGTPVLVVRDNSANKYIGIAECDGKKPLIVLAVNPRYRVSDYTFLFFREHEMAHHTLGHISCAEGRRRRSGGREQEHAADCEAQRVLENYTDGVRVWDRAYANLYVLNLPASSTHPSTADRARHLDYGC